MKLLVFAHTPPPHHGQSYMVQLMLGGFGGDRRKQRGAPAAKASEIACYHVNTRLSSKLQDIGDYRIGKLFLLLGYCVQAIWCRFRYGVRTFYYIPAPGKRSALYRDWLVMAVCRPFFKTVILHWHAAGLAKWLETSVHMRWRAATFYFMKHVDLSIVLSKYNRADAEKLFSRQIRIVSNGIPDPCPAFDREVLPRRRARFEARKKLLSGQKLNERDLEGTGGDPQVLNVLYLSHCTREKGLFDTLEGVVLAEQRLAEWRSPISLRLMVAGTFVDPGEKVEFEALMGRPGATTLIQCLGFVAGDQKDLLFREADLFCFPTYYQNENQPVNLIEAMAFGLPILTTRWRSLPELFANNYPGLVAIKSPEEICAAILALMAAESGESFRGAFLRSFTLERHLSGLTEAFLQCQEPSPPAALPAPVAGERP
jgi:glycosyltransferase involved in cell wall biosynthesis